MRQHVCPWWGGYFIDNRLRRWLHPPERILGPYVRPGMAAMDFGCGMGFFAIAMAHLVGAEGRVTAVDLQQEMLDVLERRAAKAKVDDRIRTHRSVADAIGLAEPHDFVLAFYSAHEVPGAARWFAEVRGLLRPQGTLLLVEPVGHVTAAHFQRMLDVADHAGFRPEERPRILLSHAALLVASPGPNA